MSQYLKKIVERLDSEARHCLDSAVSIAVSHTHHEVEVEHLLMAFIQCQPAMVETLCLSSQLRGDVLLDELNFALSTMRRGNGSNPVLSANLVEHLKQSWMFASIHWQQSRLPVQAFFAQALTYPEDNANPLSASLSLALNCDTSLAQERLKESCERSAEKTATRTPGLQSDSTLKKYTRNLTEQARTGMLDPVPGRESEIRQMIDVLLRRRQNNPVLAGEPGVGKTALVEGLAQRIIAGTVPDTMKTMEVLTLDLGMLQAGASVKGEFENRLQTLLREVNDYPTPVILFIDEAHTLIGAGGQAGQNDAANLLKPALARGEIRVIAATTWAEYKQYFEKDAALARRFQVIRVAEPELETATAMLRAIVPAMAKHHDVEIVDSAVVAAVRLSSRYISGRQLPDKSITLLDTACARVAVSQCHEPKEIEDINALLVNLRSEREGVSLEGGSELRMAWLAQRETELEGELAVLVPAWQQQRALMLALKTAESAEQKYMLRNELNVCQQQQALVFDRVDATCVADVVAGWTGIPLGRMVEQEQHLLGTLTRQLEARVIGQSHALASIATQLRIARANLGDPVKPAGVFMLAGPSGVGKTETALALAELFFGGERSLITINMSEYQEAHSVSGLKGSPPGYVGYGQGGVLTEAVRRQPYSVILLDEVEKAHPDVMELFYQVFDKGMMDDAEGQQINFRNTLIIMTSNLTSDLIMDAFERGERSPEAISALIRPEFDHFFKPALMGRLRLIPYFPVQGEPLEQIIRMKLKRLVARFVSACQGEIELDFSDGVVKFVADGCQVKQSGARDIDHVLLTEILPMMSDFLLDNNQKRSPLMQLSLNKGKVVLTRRKSTAAGKKP